MNKEKFGRLFYYTALIIAIIVMAIALFIQSDGSEEQNARVSIIRYMIAFYSFLGLISPGALVREYTLGYSVYKRYKLKIFALASSIVIGTLLFVLVPQVQIVLFTFLLSLLVLIFVLSPANQGEKK